MDALLLLGPTGAGKTPLGDALAAHGLGGRRCVHFDFGAAMRRAAADPASARGLDAAGHALVRRVLDAGRLLEDDEFPTAAALLDGCLQAAGATAEAWLILNGLPRHAGQAVAIAQLHRVRAVFELRATPEVVHERIRRNTGGDRAGRDDDGAAGVTARLARYVQRTRPLLAYYARLGVPVYGTEVGVTTTATEALAALREQVRAS